MTFSVYRFAHGTEDNGFRMFEEKFIREAIRNFPYKQCPLLQQLVRLIAPIQLVSQIDIQYVTCCFIYGTRMKTLYIFLFLSSLSVFM